MDKYTTLYSFEIYINNGTGSILPLSNDDVVSISIINDYDHAIFPIMRMRLYIDIDKYTYINEDPNNLTVGITGISKLSMINQSESGTTYTTLESDNVKFGSDGTLSGYVETKNNPYSKYDNYQQGIKRDDSLNTNNKIPLTIYLYDKNLVRNVKRKIQSIYKNTTLQEVIKHAAESCDVNLLTYPFDNNEKFEQILLPNLSLTDAISYIDTYYGLYKTGACLYSPNFQSMLLYTVPSDLWHDLNIRVASYKAGDSYSGPVIVNDTFFGFQTPESSVVIKSQTDLEQASNAQIFGSMNVDTFESVSTYLEETFKDSDLTNISTPDYMHKTKNKFIPSMYKARVDERNTRIDVAINGLTGDFLTFVNSVTFTFDNAIRGVDIGRSYRPMAVNHTLTNIGSGLFEFQTTMQLC